MKSLWPVFLFTCILAACASKPESKPKPTGQSTLIGMVEMVNPEQNYVLIRCDQVLSLNAGTEVTALRSDGHKSKLVLTPERKGYYLTADIKEGQPFVSDLILIQSRNLPDTAAPVTAPAVPPALPTLPGVASEPATSYTMPLLPKIPSTLPNFYPAPAPEAKVPEPVINLQELEPPVE